MRSIKYLLIGVLVISISFLPSCSTSQKQTQPSTVETITPVEDQSRIPTPSIPVEPAEIIFFNGNIITIEKDQPLAQAVAIRDNLIQAVGTDEEIMTYRGENTAVVDLQGKTLMPGFVEGHTHYTRNGWEDGLSLESMMQNLLAFGLTSITEMHSTDEYINAMLAGRTKW